MWEENCCCNLSKGCCANELLTRQPWSRIRRGLCKAQGVTPATASSAGSVQQTADLSRHGKPPFPQAVELTEEQKEYMAKFNVSGSSRQRPAAAAVPPRGMLLQPCMQLWSAPDLPMDLCLHFWFVLTFHLLTCMHIHSCTHMHPHRLRRRRRRPTARRASTARRAPAQPGTARSRRTTRCA